MVYVYVVLRIEEWEYWTRKIWSYAYSKIKKSERSFRKRMTKKPTKQFNVNIIWRYWFILLLSFDHVKVVSTSLLLCFLGLFV